MRVLNRDTDAVIPDVKHKTSRLEQYMGLRFKASGRAFFSFDRPTRQPFSMVGVRFPLDIAFLDEDMQIMEIHGALPVTLNPVTWRTYRPDEPYTYVFETEKETMVEHGFESGHELVLLDEEA